MRKRTFVVLLICIVAGLLLSVPVAAQEQEPQEPIPVSSTFSYTWESLQMATTSAYTVFDGIEAEVWSGDFEGEGSKIWHVISPSSEPTMTGWMISEFEGTVLGEYEGTMTIILYGNYPLSMEPPLPVGWYGEWAIVAGTGDLANVHGQGVWWGPGNGPNDPDPGPDIVVDGEIIFMEPMDG